MSMSFDVGTILLPQEDASSQETKGMIHIMDLDRGFPWALCGTKCRRYALQEEVECVVCLDIQREKVRRFNEQFRP